jgi:hypothetical protein
MRAIRRLCQKFGALPPLQLSENISIYGSIAVQDDTAGILLYNDNLYVNLYVMPIFDVWNRV